MSRYVNIEPYDDCKIVLHKEDVGIRCRELPTADVASVKHGQWIKYAKYSFGTMYDCSICSTRILDDGHSWHYCPNCGAKMDGERKDEE